MSAFWSFKVQLTLTACNIDTNSLLHPYLQIIVMGIL